MSIVYIFLLLATKNVSILSYIKQGQNTCEFLSTKWNALIVGILSLLLLHSFLLFSLIFLLIILLNLQPSHYQLFLLADILSLPRQSLRVNIERTNQYVERSNKNEEFILHYLPLYYYY